MSLNGLCERLLFVEAEQTQTIVEFLGRYVGDKGEIL